MQFSLLRWTWMAALGLDSLQIIHLPRATVQKPEFQVGRQKNVRGRADKEKWTAEVKGNPRNKPWKDKLSPADGVRTWCKDSWHSRIEGERRVHFESVWSIALTALEESFFMNYRKANRFLKKTFASWKLAGFCLLKTAWMQLFTWKPGLTRP